MSSSLDDLGVVIIGRNEGERLRLCLDSVFREVSRVVYVDSGSTDGSLELARGLGADVIELDLSLPFTAARARNTGWRRLTERHPGLTYVQLLDGDCELDSAWLETARRHLEENPGTAVACGRRRERHPEASVYNRLCDVEWNTPVGAAEACGGDALMRFAALTGVGGFNDLLIAGEEPDLCFRLRQQGWNIQRLPDEMTLHDATMHSWRQWWRRNQRAGHSYASLHFLHGGSPERLYQAEVRSILVWGLAFPVVVIFLTLFRPLGLLLLLAYPLQILRLRKRFLSEGTMPRKDCAPYALNCVTCKFPNLFGMLGFHWDRLLARRSRLIEYK